MPAQLAGLTQLSKLHISGRGIKGGWQHLRWHLRQSRLTCTLREVPAELAGLTQLGELQLGSCKVHGGWQQRQLLDLGLADCDLRHVPGGLVGLAQLSKLDLSDNAIEGTLAAPAAAAATARPGQLQLEEGAGTAGRLDAGQQARAFPQWH